MSSSELGAARPRVLGRPRVTGWSVPAGPLAVARWQPDVVEEPVEDRIAAAGRAAWDAGFAAGRAAAEAEAATEERAARDQLRRALLDACAGAAAARAEAVATVATEAAALAVELAEALLGHALTHEPAADRDALARALALAPAGEDLVVRMHPGRALPAAEVEALVPGASIRVVEDPSVEPGGCVLEAGACRIDTQVGPAMARARALLGLDAGSPAPGDLCLDPCLDPCVDPASGGPEGERR